MTTVSDFHGFHIESCGGVLNQKKKIWYAGVIKFPDAKTTFKH